MEWVSLLLSSGFSLASLVIAAFTLRLTTSKASRDEVRDLKEALRECEKERASLARERLELLERLVRGKDDPVKAVLLTLYEAAGTHNRSSRVGSR